jgi:ABC-2 type transport system permease protein
MLSQFINFIPQNQMESIQMGMIMIKDFLSNSTVAYENLTYIYDPSDPAAMTVEGIIRSVVSAFNYRLIGATELVSFQYQTFVTRKLNAVDYYLPGYIAAFIMTNGIIGLNSIMTDLRRRGVVKRLLSTPLTKLEWILGNILTQIFIGLLLTLVMVIFSYLVFGIVAIPDVLAIIIILVGVVAFSGLGMIFGGVFKNVEASSALGNAIAFPMMFLSGSFWSVEIMPSILQALAKIMPLTYFSDALRSAMIYKEPANAFYNLAILSVLAVVFITVGTILIRWKED